MFSRRQQSQPTVSLKPAPTSSEATLPPHYADAYQLCTNKCIANGLLNQPNIVQKSCFNRCTIKYTQSLKFTLDYIKYQNHELKKSNQQHQRQVQGVDQQGFLDKLYTIYNQNYGVIKKQQQGTA